MLDSLNRPEIFVGFKKENRMSRIKFNKSQVQQLLNNMSNNDKLTIVGDHGVYLMCFNETAEKRTIVYAEGCNPKLDEDFYDNKVRLYGGDDGVDDFGTKAELKPIVDACSKFFIVNLTPTTISCQNDAPPRPKKVKINVNHLPEGLIDKLPADLRAKLGR